MRRCCLFAAGLLLASASANPLRGVLPEARAAYLPGDGQFRCADGDGVLPAARINDDYCDCRDGSDEPGTSACSAGRYYCVNEGHFPISIFASRVGDGICDCCDGSDEAAYPAANPLLDSTICTNTCTALAARDLVHFESETVSMRAALAQRYASVKSAADQVVQERDELARLEVEVARLGGSLANVTARLTVLDEEETKQREAEDEERRAREAENAPPIVEGEVSVERPDDAKGEQTQEAEDVDHADTAEDEATSADEPAIGAGSGDGEGGAAWTQSWMRMDEPPVQPQPEPVAVPAAAAAAAANDAGAEDSDSDSSESDEHEGRENLDYDGEEGDEYESRDYEGGDDDEGVGGDDDEREGEDYDGDIDYSRSHDEGEDEGGDDWADNGADSDSDRPIPPELAELRAEKQKINTRKRSLDDRIKELKKATTLDLGPNGEFFTLSRKCFKYDAPDYTYEFCPFDHVSQKKGGVEIAALGSWQNSDGWVAVSKYTQMKYSHGMRCWSGPDRSTVVTLKCGARSEVTSVSEPEMCSYALTFVTPAACTDEHLANLEQLLSKLKAYKDEL